jgi:hypothetical protein
MPVGAEKGDTAYGHPGEELGFIFQGEGRLVYGKKEYELKKATALPLPRISLTNSSTRAKKN